MLCSCFGGLTVASNTCSFWLVASQTPDFTLVGGQSNAVARAAMPFHRAFLEAVYFHAKDELARRQVADLEAQKGRRRCQW